MHSLFHKIVKIRANPSRRGISYLFFCQLNKRHVNINEKIELMSRHGVASLMSLIFFVFHLFTAPYYVRFLLPISSSFSDLWADMYRLKGYAHSCTSEIYPCFSRFKRFFCDVAHRNYDSRRLQ